MAQKFDPSHPTSVMALETGDTLRVTVNGVAISGTIGSLPTGLSYDAATKTWSLNTSTAGSFGLQTGNSYDVAVQVTTGNGTVIKDDVSSTELVINTTPPTLTLDTVSADGYLNAAEAAQPLVVTGVTTAQVGATVTITGLDGTTRTAQVLAGVGGNNTFMLTVAAADVAAFAATNSTKTVHASVTNQFGLSASDDKTLTIDIGVPTAVADTVTVDENHVVAGSGTVSGNDTGVDTTDVYTLVGADGNGTISSTYVAIHMNSNGTYTLSPNTTNVHDITANVVETFTYKVTDAAGNSTTATLDITVTPVNTAPVNTVPTAQSTNEDTAKVISGLSIADVDANNSNVTVTLAVGHGTISLLTGAGVTLGTNGTASVTLTGTVTDINALLATANAVTYTPSLNYNGSDTFTMTTNDGGNTGAGGALTDTDTVALTVTAVNDAPVNTVPVAMQTTDEDTSKVISGLSIADVDADTSSVTVTLAVGHGAISVAAGTGVTLGTNGTASVTLSGTVTDINALLATANAVTYTPSLNYNGSDTLTMTSNDGGNTGTGGALSDADTVAITVNAVNDAPVNTVPAAQTTDEDIAKIITGLSIADVDAGTSSVTVTLAVGHGTISLLTGAGVTLGANGTTSVTLTGTVSAINALLATANAVTYTPSLNYNGGDTLTMTTNDGGNTGAGGTLSDTDTVAITVNAVNDKPTVSGINTIMAEDATYTVQVSSLLTGKVSDVDAGASVKGMFIQFIDSAPAGNNGNGAWEYSADGSTNWTSITSDILSGNSPGKALFLSFSAYIRYTPTANYNGSATIYYRAADDSMPTTVVDAVSGASVALDTGVRVNVTIAPYSATNSPVSGAQVWTNAVSAVNDAPVLNTATVVTMPSITEDAAAPSGAAAGALVSDLFTAITDADSANAKGIAITGVNGNGTLYYSTNAGTNWTVVTGTLSDSNALLLSGANRIYFKPNANWNGTIPNAFLYRAWDQTNGGTAGTKVGVGASGGATAYSADYSQVGVTVTAVNDAPTGSVTIDGTKAEGYTLTANVSTIADIDGLGAFSYKWFANGVQISGATASTYVLTTAELGKTITVEVSYTDGGNTLESLTSNATTTVVSSADTTIGSVSAEGAPSSTPSLVITDNQALTVANGATTTFTLTFSGPVAGLTESDITTTGTLVAGTLTGTGTATVINGTSYYSTYTVQVNAPASGVSSFAVQVTEGSYTDATNTSLFGKGASSAQSYGDGNARDGNMLWYTSGWNSSAGTAIFNSGNNSNLTNGTWGTTTNPSGDIQNNYDSDGSLYNGVEKIVISNKAQLNLVTGQSYSFDVDLRAVVQTGSAANAKWLLVDVNGTKLVDLTAWYTTQSNGSVGGATMLSHGVWTYVNKTYTSTVTGTYYLALAWDVAGGGSSDEMAFDRINFSTTSGGKSLSGTAAAETLTGTSSGDSITVNGADTVVAGAGNDTITVSGTSIGSIDGGEGAADTLVLSSTYGTLNLTKPAVAATVKGVEIIDLGVSGATSANTLILGVSKVIELASGSTGTTKQLIINGDSSDHLQLSAQYSNGASTGTWTAGATTTVNGVTYTIYTYSAESNLQLLVRQGVTVDTTVYSMASGDIVSVASNIVTIGDVETSASGGSTGTGDGGSQQAANVNNHTTDTSPLISGSLTQALTGTQSVKLLRINMTDASTTEVALGAVTMGVNGTSWSYQDSGLTAGKQYRYIARVMDGSTVLDDSNTYTLNVVSQVTTSSPLVLDLNGDGVHTTSVGTGTVFDLTGAGKQSVGWTTGADGFLVRDLNHDGQINSGAEMFGNNTTLANGSKAATGWDALQSLDSNADGVVDAKDSAFADLKVWVDADGDGTTDAGELRTLSDAGVVNIHVAHVEGRTVENGNVLDGAGSFTKADGTTGSMTDVWFQLAGIPQLDLTKAMVTAGVVDLTNGQAQTLKLDLNAVLGSGVTTQLVINGDSNDTVELTDLTTHWTHQAQAVTQNGHTYEVYSANNAAMTQLLIDQHMMFVHTS
jgi:hypothetical protein